MTFNKKTVNCEWNGEKTNVTMYDVWIMFNSRKRWMAQAQVATNEWTATAVVTLALVCSNSIM